MKIGIVASIDTATAKCRVQFADQDSVISYWLPVLHHKTGQDKSYWIPDVGEHVCCLMDDNAEFGVIVGAIYSDADQPPVNSQDKCHIRFKDGTWLEYDRAAHLLKADVKGDIEILATGNATATIGGTLTADVTGNSTLTTPTFTINANVIINGTLTQGHGENGGSASMLGPITVTNDVTAGGISLIHHVHQENGDGGGTTSQPS